MLLVDLMWVLLLILVCQVYSEYSASKEEVRSGLVVKPLNSWGGLARKQNSIRLLCIGGSNTANGHFVGYLNEYLKSNVSNSRTFKGSSYALNRGVSGHSALSFIGRKYDFEDKEASSWPNIVMIDTSVNFNYRKIVHKECSIILETLVKSIEFKYNLRKVEVPDFMFFNMPHFVEMLTAANLKTIAERQQFVFNYVNLTQASESLPTQINEFAVHYHFPVISWLVAMLPAAQRYFVYSNLSFSTWPYIKDAQHLSPLGAQWGVANLLAPFFREIMQPRVEEPAQAVIRLHPARPTLVEVLSYQGFWREQTLNTLRDIVYSDSGSGGASIAAPGWQLMSLHQDEEVYGSTVEGSVGELRFMVPHTCVDGLTCRVQISMIHSWNTSYVGNTSCILRSLSKSSDDHITIPTGGSLFIDGQSGVDTHTYSVKSVFPVNVTEGLHSVRCTVLVKNRLSCMHALDVNAIVLL